MFTNRFRFTANAEGTPAPRRDAINPAWEAAFAAASAAKKNEAKKREADKKRRAASYARISEIISAAFAASHGDDSKAVALLAEFSGLPRSAIIKMAEENGLKLDLPRKATNTKSTALSPAALAAQIIEAGNKARGRADEDDIDSDDEPNDDDDGDRHEFPEEKKQRKNKKSKEPEDDKPDARSALAAKIIAAGQKRRGK